MPTLDPNRPIGPLATEHPEFVPVFEDLGLDYCCGGRQSLVDARLTQGLRPAEVLDRLAETERMACSSSDDWAEVPTGDLIDHIAEDYHAYLRRELPRLEALLEKVTYVHGTEAPWMSSVKKEFNVHQYVHKENNILCPRVRERV